MNEREYTIELVTATQVINAEIFNIIRKENAMLAKFMMDKLKSFLVNDYFVAIERQTILMRFLEEQKDLDVINPVLEHIQNSELKNDYTAIIMDWTYKNSEDIVRQKLAKFDGAMLCSKKSNPIPQFKKIETQGTDEFVQAILYLTQQVLAEDNGEDGGGDIPL